MRKIVWISLTLVLCLVVVGAIVAAVLLTRDSGPEDELILDISQGPVKGRLSQNGQFYAFLGIPYGTVNVTNRFKAPLPSPSWSEIREPVSGVECYQNGGVGIEDCLIVNVFRPSVLNDDPLPVIVDIHGGAFAYGSPEEGADYLVQHDIVLVTVSYRLNIFGFLCTRSEDIPGNAGMKDQVAALRWVRDNIATFGGDPNTVTIIGNSAGGASVDLLGVSPMAAGLFQRIIAQSGSSLGDWIIRREPISTATQVAIQLGANSTNLDEVNRVLLSANPNQLHTFGMGMDFVPCIELSINGVESFLIESPLSIIASGRQSPVDIMIGFTEKEGMMVTPSNPTEEFISSLPDRINNASMPTDLIGTLNEMEVLASAARNLYYGDREINIDSIYDFMDFITDITFAWSIQRRIEERTSLNNFYYYVFEYDGGLNMVKHQNNLSYSGACHADELGYLYKMSDVFPNMIGDDNDMIMVQTLTKLWTNFAKYGNPTPEITGLLPVTWLPVDGQQYHFLKINLPLETDVNPYPERMAFWRQAYSTYFQDVVGEN